MNSHLGQKNSSNNFTFSSSNGNTASAVQRAFLYIGIVLDGPDKTGLPLKRAENLDVRLNM